jgi:predicted nucleic acid-binding protein
MKLYLDTNIILDWFKKNIKNLRKSKPIEITSKLKFLTSRPELQLFVSLITKAEIFRYLKSEWGSPENECENFWIDFFTRYGITELESKEIRVDFLDITEICKKINLGRKTLVNLIHLQFAKKNNLTFLTGDKKLEKRLKWYHEKIISYVTLRSKFSSDHPSHHLL